VTEQPIHLDADGAVRFKANTIVRYLLDHGRLDLNHLSTRAFRTEDWEQFYQLIGYSVSGYSELEVVSNKACERAERRAKEFLEKTVQTTKETP